MRAGDREPAFTVQKMEREISEYSTEDLLRMIDDDVNCERDFSYDAEQCLLRRWRAGVDLGPLIRLLESEITRERRHGAYFLGEVAQRVEGLEKAVTKLSTDSLSLCRNIFVGYMTNSGFFDETIAVGLATCLWDFDLDVRLETINWAVSTSDERFDVFRNLVETGIGMTRSKNWTKSIATRSLKGLIIARRLRAGHTVADIRSTMKEIDSFTFDYLEAFEGRFKRYMQKRAVDITSNADAESVAGRGEIGILGEEYDNRGRLIGHFLMPNTLSHLTDGQLDNLRRRADESLKQREIDKRVYN